MNTNETTTTIAKADAPTTQPKPAKSQRRMARPAQSDAGDEPLPAATKPNAAPVPAPATGSKSTAVITLLEREDGATLAELIAATGWLAHTTRAALTGLRKKGHAIVRDKRDDVTCYRIGGAG